MHFREGRLFAAGGRARQLVFFGEFAAVNDGGAAARELGFQRYLFSLHCAAQHRNLSLAPARNFRGAGDLTALDARYIDLEVSAHRRLGAPPPAELVRTIYVE